MKIFNIRKVGLSDFVNRHNFQIEVESSTGGFESWFIALMKDN